MFVLFCVKGVLYIKMFIYIYIYQYIIYIYIYLYTVIYSDVRGNIIIFKHFAPRCRDAVPTPNKNKSLEADKSPRKRSQCVSNAEVI